MCKSHRDSAGRPGCNSGSIPNAPRNSKMCYSDATPSIQRACHAEHNLRHVISGLFARMQRPRRAQCFAEVPPHRDELERTFAMTRALHTFPASIRFSNFVRRLNSRGGRSGARRRRVSHCSCSSSAPGRDPGRGANSLAYCMLCPPENPPGDDAPLPHPTSSIDRAICSSRYARYRAGDANAVLIARCCEPRLPTPEA